MSPTGTLSFQDSQQIKSGNDISLSINTLINKIIEIITTYGNDTNSKESTHEPTNEKNLLIYLNNTPTSPIPHQTA